MYGLAAHASHTTAASKHKRFKGLTPEQFLRGDPTDLKATLGQLVDVFGDQFLIRTQELDRFVDDRNFICHNYWRSVHTNIRGGRKGLEHPIEFLQNFIARSDKLLSVVRGFLALLMKSAAINEAREFEPTDQQQADVVSYLSQVEEHLKEHQQMDIAFPAPTNVSVRAFYGEEMYVIDLGRAD